ncbi:MAG: NAD(P)-dependent oxidoreductase [Burkholderiales bacterium]|nr:NAD(P)-dependent oxidoreductase [Burkholderiales bacterium]
MQPPAMRVGVIGLGALGQPISELLLKARYRTAVYDVRREPMRELAALGAQACASPAEVAEQSDLIISLVSDAAQTDTIVSGDKGILDTFQRGAIFATGSTLGPEPVQRIAMKIAAKGGDTLDMPISGGIIAAREGTLSLMVGGTESTLQRAMPVFRTFARDITHTGAVGSGQAAKLAHQLVFSVNVMALLEGLALGVAGGVSPEVMKSVLKQGLANSTVLQVWHDLGPRWKGMLEATEPGAPLPNMRKDLHLVLELAESLGMPLQIAEHASKVADSGTAIGHDDPLL